MTISLCMVVRDEAENLPRFLEAVRGCWDELCVVDTGSVDATKALLSSAGATIVDRRWDDDFAAARNASLAMATGDWVLILDPDEFPTAEFATALRAATASPACGALLVSMRNLLHGGHHRDCALLRVFRNDPTVRYEHRIHEDAGRSVQGMLDRTGLVQSTLAPRIVHEGYLRERAESKDKRSRDRRILESAIADDPHDLYLRFKLLEQARYWEDADLLHRCASETVDALAEPNAPLADGLNEVPWGGELLTLLAQGCAATPAAELDLLDSWAPAVSPGPALTLRRGELLEALGRLGEAGDAYRACLVADDDGTRQRTTSRPLLGLVRLALMAGRMDEARGFCTRALAHAPHDPEAQLASTFLQSQPR